MPSEDGGNMQKDDIELLNQQELLDQFEQLKERASKDALTGLLNRGTVEKYINEQLKQMKKNDRCAMFIIDLDNFKEVNDTLGHQAGDQVIRRSAKILSGLFRATDIVGRLGGDEFIIFLCGHVTESLVRKKGYVICEQLQLVVGSSLAITVSASVGIHLTSGPAQSFSSLYRLADLALYKAKKSGRQNFCVEMNTGEYELPNEVYNPVNAMRLKGMLEHICSGVAMLEMDTPVKFIYVSPSFCRMIGVEVQRLSNAPVLEFIHPDDHVEFEKMLRMGVEQSIEISCICRIQSNKNGWLWCRIHVVKVDHDSSHPVLLMTANDISDLKEKESYLKENNELLQMVFDQTMQGIWEVDFSTRTFRMLGGDTPFDIKGESLKTFPEDLISSRCISHESGERFREFAEEMFDGRVQGYGNFIMKNRDTNGYGWASLSYRTVFDEVGRPVKAVGIIQSLNRSIDGEAEIQKKEPLPEALAPYLILELRANLTKDTVSKFWMEGKDLTNSYGVKGCSSVLAMEKDKIFSKQDFMGELIFFERERLQEALARKEQWFSAEYRRIDNGGNISWVLCVLNLYEDSLTGDNLMSACLCQLNQRHQWEVDVGMEICRDSNTNLYDRTTVRAMAEVQMHQRKACLCAMTLIEVSGMSTLYASNPEEFEKKRSYIFVTLTLALGTVCIPGQYSQDKVLVFFPEISSEKTLRNRLEQAFTYVRSMLSDIIYMDALRFLAGVICNRVDEADYDCMLKKSLALCTLWKNSSTDLVVFPEEEGDWSWKEIQKSNIDDKIRIHHEEMSRPLSEREKDAAFECVLSMLDSESLESSIYSVLDCIGKYYRADRVYLLVLEENNRVVTMPHEWTSQRKYSIQQTVSGMRTECFPLLQRCIREEAPIFLCRTKHMSMSMVREEEPWCFTIFPMKNEAKIEGFLCIENAQEHPSDAALPGMLIPYILKERQKYCAYVGQTSSDFGSCMGDLPNLNSYMEVIYTFNSDVYSSLGAVCLDIPELSAKNGNIGFEYGRKLVLYVSQILHQIFGKTMIFRTWDAEFVALCPNTTQQVFLGKCTRLQTALSRRYPKGIRLGFTWAERVFNGKALVEEARSLMRCDSAVIQSFAHRLIQGSGNYGSVGEAVKEGRFTVFFQPKINMLTGELHGAEALIRGLDENGNIVPPVRFLEKIEKNEKIRDLDLFVLDRTLFLLDQWREEGLDLIQVSVNFSKATLFNPTALASLLAIQSRYPLLDPGLIELEITESDGNLSQDTLKNLMEKFREFNIKFSLDDFGSLYSNLSIFTNIKFDTVKLDRSLVAEISRNEMSQRLVKNIVRLCKARGMVCVAEGVETMEQIVELTKAGCTYAQGYYYDCPLTAEKFRRKYLQIKDKRLNEK